nr:hypothetical protein BdHM001_36250 [Bdellovibrio sp. HM001]
MKQKRKVRKPSRIVLHETLSAGLDYNETYPVRISTFIGPIRLRLEWAKRLHKWLGKAIEYLETKEGER